MDRGPWTLTMEANYARESSDERRMASPAKPCWPRLPSSEFMPRVAVAREGFQLPRFVGSCCPQ